MEMTARRSRAEAATANRAAVLEAAWDVFSEVGYVAASLDRIAERAGFSKGVVYSRFGSKADLFLALLERRINDRARANVSEAEHARADGVDVVQALAERMIAQSHRDHGWRLALVEFRLATARDPELRARYTALHEDTVGRLAALFEELGDHAGAPLGLPARSLAVTILALDVGTLLEDLAAGALSDADRVEIIRRVLTPVDRERAS